MRAIAFLLVLVGCVSWTAFAGEKPADPHDDSRNILGTWKYVSFIEGGEKRQIPDGMRVVITKDIFSDRRPGQDARGMRYAMDSSRNPKEIDFIVELDPGHPIRQPGIYELKGDRLRIHSAAAGAPRPKDFEPVKGETGGVLVLERLTDKSERN